MIIKGKNKLREKRKIETDIWPKALLSKYWPILDNRPIGPTYQILAYLLI